MLQFCCNFISYFLIFLIVILFTYLPLGSSRSQPVLFQISALALPDLSWPLLEFPWLIPDPTWALPDLSLGSSRSQPGLLRSSAEIWKTPAKTWSRNQIKQPPCKPASQPAKPNQQPPCKPASQRAKPNQPNPAQPSQPTATTCHHASIAGKRTSKQANRLAHTQARLHLNLGSYSREGIYQ